MFGSKTIHGTLLIAGTCIGGGMLALPVVTSLGGFIPAIVIYFFCWVFMASTGLLFSEVALWMKRGTNILSMAEKTLGFYGKVIAWVLYLFLFYTLTLAYIDGCGELITHLFHEKIAKWVGSLIFIFALVPFLFSGTKAVSKLNVFFIFGLAATYFAFVLLCWRHVDRNYLLEQDWQFSFLALPVVFTAFAYQGIVPTIVDYLDRDKKKIVISILVGSFIPFVAYVVWEWLILGTIPTYGAKGLKEAYDKGQTAIQPLITLIRDPMVALIGSFFAFFALATSFFGVSLGLVDFLADGLRIKKNNKGKTILLACIFIPTFLMSMGPSSLFLVALEFAGGIGVSLLLGVLPIMMVWTLRYRQKKPPMDYFFPGGKLWLLLLFVFVVLVMFCEGAQIALRFLN